MLKKEFYSEISTIVEKSKKDEFGMLAKSVKYFKSIHKELSEKFEDEIAQKSDPKTWSNFLREIRFWKSLGIVDMYTRTMQLSLLFTNKYEEFFKIESEIGSFTVPTRLGKFLKIALIAEEFVDNIFPKIENNINFKSDRIIENSHTISGTVDWNSTVLSSLQRGEEYPTQFTCIINQNNFETSENILALICLLKLHDDLESLVFNLSEIEHVKKEARRVLDLKTRIDFLISHTHMRDFVTKYERYRYSNLHSKVIKDFELETKERVQKGKIKQKAYSELLEWLRKYRGYNLGGYNTEGTMQKYGEFPIQHERSLDTMYELWIYFEILNYFKSQDDVNILSSLKNNNRNFVGFELEILNKNLKFNFQDKRVGWTDQESKPDFTIEIDGDIPVILDPKNYSTTQTGDAIHKMLGYMVNLGKFNPELGILFFPYGIPRNEIDGNSNEYHPLKESTATVFDRTLTFSTIILNPTKPEEMKENLKNIYERVYDIVQRKTSR